MVVNKLEKLLTVRIAFWTFLRVKLVYNKIDPWWQLKINNHAINPRCSLPALISKSLQLMHYLWGISFRIIPLSVSRIDLTYGTAWTHQATWQIRGEEWKIKHMQLMGQRADYHLHFRQRNMAHMNRVTFKSWRLRTIWEECVKNLLLLSR